MNGFGLLLSLSCMAGVGWLAYEVGRNRGWVDCWRTRPWDIPGEPDEDDELDGGRNWVPRPRRRKRPAYLRRVK
jgi:hypothetical protein